MTPLATQAPPVLYLLQSASTAMKIDINSGPSPHCTKQVGVSQETKTSQLTALPEPNSLLQSMKNLNFSNKTPNWTLKSSSATLLSEYLDIFSSNRGRI